MNVSRYCKHDCLHLCIAPFSEPQIGLVQQVLMRLFWRCVSIILDMGMGKESTHTDTHAQTYIHMHTRLTVVTHDPSHVHYVIYPTYISACLCCIAQNQLRIILDEEMRRPSIRIERHTCCCSG